MVARQKKSRGASAKKEAEIIPVEPEQGNSCEGKALQR